MLLDYADAEMRDISAHDTAKVAAMRAEALKRFAESGFPNRKMEHWRNSKSLKTKNITSISGRKPLASRAMTSAASSRISTPKSSR